MLLATDEHEQESADPTQKKTKKQTNKSSNNWSVVALCSQILLIHGYQARHLNVGTVCNIDCLASSK